MQTAAALSLNWPSAFIGLVCSFLVALLIVLTKNWHGRLTLDAPQGIQKFHTTPTPRIGGLALAVGFVAAWAFLPIGSSSQYLLGLLLLGAIPAFGFGLAEDLTKRIGVNTRLIATISSGLIAALLTGYWVQFVNVPGLDLLLALAPVGILFTAFAVGGLANGVNIVDGFHGLAGGVVVLMLATLATIAWRVDDLVIIQLALLGVSVTLGFLFINYPRGHLFLGDAGAYFLGYYVAMLGVMLAMRNPVEVSPWAILLVCGYPVIETLFSVYRRATRKRRHNPGAPDASHLHSLVYRRVVNRTLLPYAPAWQRNAATSPLMWIYAAVPMLGAVFWPESLAMVMAWLLFSVMAYIRLYRRMLEMSVFFRRREG
ncbi:MAG: glycosyltransferase [Limnobacter sp.]|uniref:MraY family glycosyltransferase n=1 Tax=Limnobacter sp. TaxID=2003368 RepID=UPI0022C4FF07|nr:glycosyltransferase [Limnobacter sp.]MCZ8016514.1 glycosyltransferase [Limnobacter sp.]